MNAVLIGLSLASVASAQVVNGVSALPMSMAYGYAEASSSGGYAPPSAYYTAPPSNSYSAPPSQYTAPPSSYDIYSIMPYSSFVNGGYSSMDCGYGYQKQSDGTCSQMAGVGVDSTHDFCHLLTVFPQYSMEGCYETIIINHE